jgi:hypothetical protein
MKWFKVNGRYYTFMDSHLSQWCLEPSRRLGPVRRRSWNTKSREPWDLLVEQRCYWLKEKNYHTNRWLRRGVVSSLAEGKKLMARILDDRENQKALAILDNMAQKGGHQ